MKVNSKRQDRLLEQFGLLEILDNVFLPFCMSYQCRGCPVFVACEEYLKCLDGVGNVLKVWNSLVEANRNKPVFSSIAPAILLIVRRRINSLEQGFLRKDYGRKNK